MEVTYWCKALYIEIGDDYYATITKNSSGKTTVTPKEKIRVELENPANPRKLYEELVNRGVPERLGATKSVRARKWRKEKNSETYSYS